MRYKCRYETIMERLDAGWSYDEVAREFKTEPGVIAVYDKARTGNLATRLEDDDGERDARRDDIALIGNIGRVVQDGERGSIEELYNAGYTIKEIAKIKRKPPAYISYVLERSNVKLRRMRTMIIPTAEEIDAAVRLVEDGMSVYGAAQEARINYYYLADAVRARGIIEQGHLKRVTEAQWEEVVELYLGGMSIEKLGRHLGTASARVSAELKRRGVKVRSNGWK